MSTGVGIFASFVVQKSAGDDRVGGGGGGVVSRSVMSNSLQLHGMQHARLPCLTPTPRACSNSCPSSR